MELNEWKLDEFKYERDKWGADPDKFEARITYSNGKRESFSLVVPQDVQNKIMDLLNEQIAISTEAVVKAAMGFGK